ncbi:MAG: flagellar hook-associated protein FlgK [Epulopiscium sp.]|nr:flagellar hook-associated protein FlgK [Candidatus Epulonipiscium sp.]
MNSSFFGINIGAQALYTARTALDVTSHNISNMGTEGYSRQIAKQKATMPIPLGTGKGMVGTGSEVYDIVRQRDVYLDTKFWNENKMLGEFTIKRTQLSLIEGIFNEPSDEGFNTIFNDFFSAFQEVADNPESMEARNGLKEQALTFTKFFNDAATRLKEYQKDINFEIGVRVKDINTIAQKIESLNREIFRYERHGDKANDLRDQRDLLVDRLSRIVNTEAKEIEAQTPSGEMQKQFIVSINGQTLVNHFTYNQLEIKVRESKNNPTDAENLYDIYWGGGVKFDTTSPTLSGEIKGYMDIRDGNNNNGFKGKIESVDIDTREIVIANASKGDMNETGEIKINGKAYKYSSFNYDEDSKKVTMILEMETPIEPGSLENQEVQIGSDMGYKGIPHYMNRLNEFVRTFARAFNEGKTRGGKEIPEMTGHAGGYGLNGETENHFFAYRNADGNIKNMTTGIDYETLTAENFTLSKDIDDVANIAAAKEKGLKGDGRMMQELFSIKINTEVFNEGTPGSYMESIMGELGVNTKQAVMIEDMQINISKIVENQRMSVSGVDSNEEMTNLIKFNQAYNMAAKMISVMDAIYDVTINRMGVS